jgi:Tfp pilus assembly protein PilN
MSARLGLELGREAIRAVLVSGWPRRSLRSLDVAWDPEEPGPAFAALRDSFGAVRQVSIAVDLELLRVKRVKLPALPGAQRRRILGLEPDRYFAVRGEQLVFATREDDDLVFAMSEPTLASWMQALAEFGVERIEPGPVALARTLESVGVTDGLVLRGGAGRGVETLELIDGRLQNARRRYGDLAGAASDLGEADVDVDVMRVVYLDPWQEETARQLVERWPDREVKPLPGVADLGPAHLCAYGATLGTEAAWRESLLTPELERRHRRRRRTRLLTAAASVGIAALFLLSSLDASRARAERQLDARIAALRDQAAEVLALQGRAAALGREAQAISDIEAERADLLGALLELSRGLPADAWIRTIQAEPPDWYLDGWASDAAALIPLFENDPRFEDVQFRSATSRAQIGNETYDYFSLALRTVPAP